MGADPERHLRAERTHLRAALTHDMAAAFWEEHRELARATVEREKSRMQREGAKIERERYRAETGLDSGPLASRHEVEPPVDRRWLRAESERLRDESRRLRARTQQLSQLVTEQGLCIEEPHQRFAGRFAEHA